MEDLRELLRQNSAALKTGAGFVPDGMSYTQIAKVLGRDEKSTDNALQRLKSKNPETGVMQNNERRGHILEKIF